MEGMTEELIEELRQKAIERDGGEGEEINIIDDELKDAGVVDEVPSVIEEKPKKTKKVRSQKQIEAFEKARLKRAENLKIKKQLEAEKKLAKKAEKEEVKKEVKQRLMQKEEQSSIDVYQPEVPVPSAPTKIPAPANATRYKEQVVNNYYYYHAPPEVYPEGYQEPPKKRSVGSQRKKKVVFQEPEPETSSEEEEIYYPPSPPAEPDSYKELQNYQEEDQRQLPPKPNNSLKFRFA